MNEFKAGSFAVATAGHDSGKYYVIISEDKEYVYLVDGKIRTLNHMKKKKKKHVRSLNCIDTILADKIIRKTVSDVEIKRAIKLMQKSLTA